MGLIRYSCGHISGHYDPNSCQIWCARVFHHVLLKYGHEYAEMQKKKKIWWRHTSVLYRLDVAFCSFLSRLSFLFVKNIVLAPSWWRGESNRFCFAKPLAPPAKDSLRSSFASGGLSRLRRSILALRACGLFLTNRVTPSLWQRLD